MIKKVINQKGKLDEELIDIIEPNFVFKDKPINRFNIIENSNDSNQADKVKLLAPVSYTHLTLPTKA